MTLDELYRKQRQWAEWHGIALREKALGKNQAGKFDGLSITINTDNNPHERAFFVAHSIGSIVRWAVATEQSAAIYAELRDAKEHKDEDPERFERGLEGFCRFEETASEHAVWLLADLGAADAIPPYTAFARADLDSMLEFHRTGQAPNWDEFFKAWKEKADRDHLRIRPYQPRPIPPFHPVKIQTQEIVQVKE